MIITDSHVFFYSGTIYSNFHWTPGQFRYPRAQAVFSSSEAGFMWEKATFFGDSVIAQAILLAGSSFEVKALGRKVQGYDDKAWECVRLGLMQHVLLAKFTQNPAWAGQLRGTGNRVLVEASPVDRTWGVGMDIETAAAYVRTVMQDDSPICPHYIAFPNGRNLLGQALMTVRGML